MATVKLKFRNSKIKNKEGSLYFQITHNRVVKYITTSHKIMSNEWHEKRSTIQYNPDDKPRTNHLQAIESSLNFDKRLIEQIIISLTLDGRNFHADDIVHRFANHPRGVTLFSFTQEVIARLKLIGKERTSETYAATLRSFARFRGGYDIPIQAMDSDLMESYESYLRQCGITPNTSSFYMRILRAIYNRAVDKGLTEQHYPFKQVYTGVDKTVKRAIIVKYIKRIKDLDLSKSPRLCIVRDIFLFSFYTRGMSFIDMAYLRKKDLKDGILSYRRRKTNQSLHIKWEECMQEILDKYRDNDSPYLLPIIKSSDKVTDRNQYRNALISYNRRLKEIGVMAEVITPLTMYVARHSWASIAKSNNIPISVISEGMGHDSESTTQIYLASLNTSIIDDANNTILNLL